VAIATIDIPQTVIDEIAKRAAELVRPAEDRWLDAKGAAEYLAVPVSTIHKLSAARAIPSSQDVPGGKLYFRRSALDAWRCAS
jgi:excisionase family DNA binding protein